MNQPLHDEIQDKGQEIADAILYAKQMEKALNDAAEWYEKSVESVIELQNDLIELLKQK